MHREQEMWQRSVYENALEHLAAKDYTQAAHQFDLLRQTAYRDANQYYDYTLAAQLCVQGFMSRALAAFEVLGGFHNAPALVRSIRTCLSAFEGVYRSNELFCANYMFLHEGRAAFESAYLYSGCTEMQYELQFLNGGVYALYTGTQPLQVKQYKLLRKNARNISVVPADGTQPPQVSFSGEYVQIDTLQDAAQQNKTRLKYRCPVCGAPLIKVTEKKKPYARCTNYPVCHTECFIEPSSGRVLY